MFPLHAAQLAAVAWHLLFGVPILCLAVRLVRWLPSMNHHLFHIHTRPGLTTKWGGTFRLQQAVFERILQCVHALAHLAAAQGQTLRSEQREASEADLRQEEHTGNSPGGYWLFASNADAPSLACCHRRYLLLPLNRCSGHHLIIFNRVSRSPLMNWVSRPSNSKLLDPPQSLVILFEH